MQGLVRMRGRMPALRRGLASATAHALFKCLVTLFNQVRTKRCQSALTRCMLGPWLAPVPAPGTHCVTTGVLVTLKPLALGWKVYAWGSWDLWGVSYVVTSYPDVSSTLWVS